MKKSILEVIESVEIVVDKYAHSWCETTSCCYSPESELYTVEVYRDRVIEALREAGYIPKKK